jgi:hypothetical protein
MTNIGLALTVLATLLWGSLAYVAWYGKFWWWDNLAHLSAGASIGGWTALIVTHFGYGGYAVILAVVVSGIAALIWEAIEFVEGVWPWTATLSLDRKWSDTLLDSYLVLTGSALSGIIFMWL